MSTKKPKHRGKHAPSMANIRSAITNGSQLLADVDHRSARMRRLRDLIDHYSAYLGPNISPAKEALLRRACLMQLELEMREAKFEQNGGATDNELRVYQMCVGSFRRLLAELKLDDRPNIEAIYIEEVA